MGRGDEESTCFGGGFDVLSKSSELRLKEGLLDSVGRFQLTDVAIGSHGSCVRVC